jgi:hypothetical protein
LAASCSDPIGRPQADPVILFLAANQRDTGRLALDREARAIHVELERSGYRDRFDHSAPDYPMYRIAADGYHASDGRWSAEAMRWIAIDPAAVKVYEANIIFRAYGVLSTADGKYGGDQPIAPTTTET